MEVILMLIGASFLVALFFLIGFIWSVKAGQFEDVETPSFRMLMDSKPSSNKKINKKQND